MHIPDGFLNNGTAGSLMATAVAAVGFAISKVRSGFLEKIPVLDMPSFAAPTYKDSRSDDMVFVVKARIKFPQKDGNK